MAADSSLFSTGMVAEQIGVPRWWLLYHIERGDVPGPSLRVAGRRLFTVADVAGIREALKAVTPYTPRTDASQHLRPPDDDVNDPVTDRTAHDPGTTPGN